MDVAFTETGKTGGKGRVRENPEVQFTSVKSVNPEGNQP